MDYKINSKQYQILKRFEHKQEIEVSSFTKEEITICEELLHHYKFLTIAQINKDVYYAYRINSDGLIALEYYEKENEAISISKKSLKKSRNSNIISALAVAVALAAFLLALLKG